MHDDSRSDSIDPRAETPHTRTGRPGPVVGSRSAPSATATFARIGALLLTLCVSGLLAAAADAAHARRKHAIKLTVVESQISTTNPNPAGPPAVGSTTVRAGVVSQMPGGSGAVVDRVTITSLSLSTDSATFKGRATFFLLNGTLSVKSAGRATRHADGSLTISGTATYTRGTGVYKSVTGHLNFVGGSPNTPGSVTTFHLVGTATY